MIKPSPIRRTRKPSEDGFMLLAVICLLALMMIALAVAAPRIAADIKRDREVETMHRGKQYTRAIQLYYRKFHRYPPNLDALVKTNETRFLRKKYIDPTTGKDEWKPVMFGQNKTPAAMGFFGQPLMGTGGAGSTLAGTGPANGNNLMGAATITGGMVSPFGGGSAGIGLSSAGTNPSAPGTGTTDPSNGTATDGSNGAAAGGAAAGSTDANGTSTGGSSPLGGQTFGGGGIIGVSPMSPKVSILTYKKKNHYNEWEFLYSPLNDQQQMTTGGSPGSTTPPGTGAPGVTTQPSGFGITPTTPPATSPAPQQ